MPRINSLNSLKYDMMFSKSVNLISNCILLNFMDSEQRKEVVNENSQIVFAFLILLSGDESTLRSFSVNKSVPERIQSDSEQLRLLVCILLSQSSKITISQVCCSFRKLL
uniref:Uncharacterized protein n=1 Tax=Caenorhabditis tropicalis TaxID=1561998 RepID=A0A1I7UHQ5_9PELO